MPKIEISGLSKMYDSATILKDVSFGMAHNEFTVFLGPSGCGKSTLLRMIAGLEAPSSGKIIIDNVVVNNFSPKKRNIAMVFQDYALYPHMSVQDNLLFSFKLSNSNKNFAKQKMYEIAEMLDISQLLKRKPSDLSGGQRQRVAIGRALVRDTPIFLLDEPLSNLDAELRTKMRVEFGILSKKLQKNFIYVTHDQIEAMALGNQIVVFNKSGKIQQKGTPKELFETPNNKFVAGFIGSPSMNFLDANLTLNQDCLYAEGDGFKLALSSKCKFLLQKHSSSKITLGIRPMHLRPLCKKPEDNIQNLIKTDILFEEYLGSSVLYSSKCNNSDVLIEIPCNANNIYKKTKEFKFVTVDSNNIHLFNPETELSIR